MEIAGLEKTISTLVHSKHAHLVKVCSIENASTLYKDIRSEKSIDLP